MFFYDFLWLPGWNMQFQADFGPSFPCSRTQGTSGFGAIELAKVQKHTHAQKKTYTSLHAYMHACIHTCIGAVPAYTNYMHACMHEYAHTHTYAYIRLHTHSCTGLRRHTQAYMRRYNRIYIRRHTYAYIHTQIYVTRIY